MQRHNCCRAVLNASRNARFRPQTRGNAVPRRVWYRRCCTSGCGWALVWPHRPKTAADGSGEAPAPSPQRPRPCLTLPAGRGISGLPAAVPPRGKQAPRCLLAAPGTARPLLPSIGCRGSETRIGSACPAGGGGRTHDYISQHAPRLAAAPPPSVSTNALPGLQLPACCAPHARRRLTVRPRGLRFPACPAPRGGAMQMLPAVAAGRCWACGDRSAGPGRRDMSRPLARRRR